MAHGAHMLQVKQSQVAVRLPYRLSSEPNSAARGSEVSYIKCQYAGEQVHMGVAWK